MRSPVNNSPTAKWSRSSASRRRRVARQRLRLRIEINHRLRRLHAEPWSADSKTQSNGELRHETLVLENCHRLLYCPALSVRPTCSRAASPAARGSLTTAAVVRRRWCSSHAARSAAASGRWRRESSRRRRRWAASGAAAVEVVRPAVVQPHAAAPLSGALRPAVAGNSVEVAVGRIPVEQLAAEVVRPAAVVECPCRRARPGGRARPAVARVDNSVAESVPRPAAPDTLRRSVAPRPSVIQIFPRELRVALRTPPDVLPREFVRRRVSTRARRPVCDRRQARGWEPSIPVAGFGDAAADRLARSPIRGGRRSGEALRRRQPRGNYQPALRRQRAELRQSQFQFGQ